MRKSSCAYCLFAVLLVFARGASAHPMGAEAPYVVAVEDEWGRPLRTFHEAGTTFVLGEDGARYNVRVRNQTGARVEAVLTVDGRDVVSGRTGSFVTERGYILEPYGEITIEGFRRSLDEVAAFRFTTPGDSYSARMGTPENVGVIGAAFFPERARLRRQIAPARPLYEGKASASPGAPSTDNLGTEYGESHYSRVNEARFERADATHPAQVITLRYDDEHGLLARGIETRRQPLAPRREPRAFPRSRFAPPPP